MPTTTTTTSGTSTIIVLISFWLSYYKNEEERVKKKKELGCPGVDCRHGNVTAVLERNSTRAKSIEKYFGFAWPSLL